MLTYVVGDATRPITTGKSVLAHVCNDMGRWGRGFVISINKTFENIPCDNYREWYRQQYCSLTLGDVQFVEINANMVAQRGVFTIRGVPPIRYDAFRTALCTVFSAHSDVHMPRIGCGFAGGQWEYIEEILLDTLSEYASRCTTCPRRLE